MRHLSIPQLGVFLWTQPLEQHFSRRAIKSMPWVTKLKVGLAGRSKKIWSSSTREMRYSPNGVVIFLLARSTDDAVGATVASIGSSGA
jgi:hypothetical protein